MKDYLESLERGEDKGAYDNYADPEVEKILSEKKQDRFKRQVSQRITVLDRLPAHNLQAEMAILGIYLVHPEKRGEHDRDLSEYFYYDKNEKIHRTIAGLHHLDLILLVEELKRQENLKNVGGLAYLSELYKIGQNTNPDHLQDYIRIIREKAVRRSVIHYSSAVFRDGFEPGKDIGETIKRLIDELSAIEEKYF